MFHLFLPKLLPEKPKPFAACHAVPSGGFKEAEKREQSVLLPTLLPKRRRKPAFLLRVAFHFLYILLLQALFESDSGLEQYELVEI